MLWVDRLLDRKISTADIVNLIEGKPNKTPRIVGVHVLFENVAKIKEHMKLNVTFIVVQFTSRVPSLQENIPFA